MALTIDSLDDRHRPQKSWGWEEWIVNNDLYCGKRLHFSSAGGCTSLHFHMNKHETMYVEKGSFSIVVVDQVEVREIAYHLGTGDSLVIEPGTIHRIISAEDDSILVEFSTHHEDSDSYRVKR